MPANKLAASINSEPSRPGLPRIRPLRILPQINLLSPVLRLVVPMKNFSLKVLSLTAVLATAGLAVAQTGSNDATLSQLAGYRKWTRVNREPVITVAPPSADTTGI